MRHSILVSLVIGSIMIFFGCQGENAFAPELSQTDQATVFEESALIPELDHSNKVTNSLAKPAPYLIGIVNTPFSDANPPIFWKGTVDFGGVEYGLYFVSHGVPRDFSQASPFEEEFVIHELNDEGNIYMKGWNAGLVTYANRFPNPVKFLSNGKVVEASGPFDGWQDRSVHIHGLVYWAFDDETGLPTGLPDRAEGTFQIN